MPLLPAAIGIILNDDASQVLLVKRRDIPVWVLPGGGIEPEEAPETAVKREVFEETGLEVGVIRRCATYLPVNRLTSHTSTFLCQIEKGKPTSSNETSAIAFYPLSQLPLTFFHLHAHWLQEALKSSHLIVRPLTEVSYFALFRYFIRHPWLFMRYCWTRICG